MEGNFRIAHAFGKKQNFAMKFTASYTEMKDWVADDPLANAYGDISAKVNLSNIVSQLQYDPTLSPEDHDQWVALNNYIEFNPVVGQIGLNEKTIVAPGYLEQTLAENKMQSIKSSFGMFYKDRKSTRLNSSHSSVSRMPSSA